MTAVYSLTLRLSLVLMYFTAVARETNHTSTVKIASKGLNPDDFLHQFGYFQNDHRHRHNKRQARKHAVRLYQRMNGLTQTGKVNRQTWELMQKPRCGNPDVGIQLIPSRETGVGRVKRSTSKRSKRAGKYDYRWLQRSLTWGPIRFLTKMAVSTQWAAFRKAFEVWSEPSRLTLNYDPVNPDIRLAFWRGEHGDGSTFDGRGRLLAHAFPPGDQDLAGDVHFDGDEEWTVGVSSDRSKDLLMVALHEVGHAVGLSHSPRQNDIMYAVYGSYTPHPALSRNDARRLRRLYGKNPAYKWTPPPAIQKNKSVSRQKARRVIPRWCRMHFNDVIRGPYGRGYIFSQRYVYRFSSLGVEDGYPVHVRQEFPGAPINPQAVVHVREGTKTFFFKGKRLWRYTKDKLDSGYPKAIVPVFPEKPRAAINIKDRKGHSTIYIFGTRLFWQWNHDSESVSSAFLHISDFWSQLPSRIDAAVQWSDNYLYFFKNNKYYKVSQHGHRLLQGYPKVKGPAWLRGACGSKAK